MLIGILVFIAFSAYVLTNIQKDFRREAELKAKLDSEMLQELKGIRYELERLRKNGDD